TPTFQAKADLPTSRPDHPGTTVPPTIQRQIESTPETPGIQAQADSVQPQTQTPTVQAKADLPTSLPEHPGTTVPPTIQRQLESSQLTDSPAIQAQADSVQPQAQTLAIQAKAEAPTSLPEHPGITTLSQSQAQPSPVQASPSQQSSTSQSLTQQSTAPKSSRSRSRSKTLTRPSLGNRLQRQHQAASVLTNLGRLQSMGQSAASSDRNRAAAAFPPLIQRQAESGSSASRRITSHPGTTAGSWANVEDLLRQTEPGAGESSTPLQRQATPKTPKRDRTMPTAWSNIEDLLNQTSPAPSPTAPPLQRQPEPAPPAQDSPTSDPNASTQPTAKRKPPPGKHPGTSASSLANLSQLKPRQADRSRQPSIQRTASAKTPKKQKQTRKKSLGQSQSLGNRQVPLGKKANRTPARQAKSKSGWTDLSAQMTKVTPTLQRQTQTNQNEQEQIFTTPQGVQTPRRQSYHYTLQRQAAEAAPPVSAAESSSELSSEEEADYLETLAQEIYNIVREQIATEQERRGRGYLGRLPW
ncbi:MAG: hypothetical protein AAGG51_28770, partial [Cyanobacteria bacterium P01_G01_bin.54]